MILSPYQNLEVAMQITKGDWVRVKVGALRGAEGHVRELKDGVATIRQLNGNEINVPVNRIEFGKWEEVIDGLQ